MNRCPLAHSIRVLAVPSGLASIVTEGDFGASSPCAAANASGQEAKTEQPSNAK